MSKIFYGFLITIRNFVSEAIRFFWTTENLSDFRGQKISQLNRNFLASRKPHEQTTHLRNQRFLMTVRN